jgi:UDP-N-acetylglucosamine--N-acetylmuramyl-(pentapeptide) pyrophosphoryl-undecaprenol N-acetylglucosamine transferase
MGRSHKVSCRMSAPFLRVIVAGGGTGGHLYPGIAVARCFQARCPGTEVRFLGLAGGLEERLVPREGFRLHTVTVKALKGRSKLAQIGALAVLGKGTLQALAILRRVRPHLVIGTGGYVMGPAVLAATLLRLPRVILEQNLLPGIAVRTLAHFSQAIFTSFPETSTYLPKARVEYTGTPVRQDICEIETTGATDHDGRLHVLIFGGSQGACRINRAVLEALPYLAKHHDCLRIVHQTGTTDFEEVSQAYQQTTLEAEASPFLYDMADRYRWTHLVICRAGASTLAELTVCGKPAILIPYPYAADDHQRLNALALQQQGAAQMILEAELTGERLYEAIHTLLRHPEQLHQQTEHSRRLGKPQAADTIVTSCLRLLGFAAE